MKSKTLSLLSLGLSLALTYALVSCQGNSSLTGSLFGSNNGASTIGGGGTFGTFAVQANSLSPFNLGTTQTVPVTVTADSNYTGTVAFSINEPELVQIDTGQAIGFTISPSTVSLTPGTSATVNVTVNVGTMAPDFSSSLFHVVATDTSHPAGQAFLTSAPVSLQVNAVFVVNILVGAESGTPESWTVPANSTVSFVNHPNGLTVSFNDLDSNTKFPPRIHSTAATGTIQHQPGDLVPSLDGKNPNPSGGTYTQTVTAQTQTSDLIYDHNNESSSNGGRTFVYNVPVVAPSPSPTGNPNGTYTYLNNNVFHATANACVKCHDPTTKAGGYDFTTYSGVMMAVKAGSAVTSPLYLAVQGGTMPCTSLSASCGTTQTTAPLSSALIQDMADWINSGAPNN